ncbi:MAG: DEAD/DEAH box helicase [Nitrosomonas sp.]|nr:MAG: DEAD/DEAH box helicase [Nitrosomonas sp.]
MSVTRDERTRLFELYRKSTTADSAVVNLLAVAWGGLNKTQITNALRKIIGASEIADIQLESLKRSGLIEADKVTWTSQRIRCNRLIVELVAHALAATGDFDRYVKQVHSVEPLQKSRYLRNTDDLIFRHDDELIREVRIGIYQNDTDYIQYIFDTLRRHKHTYWNGLAERWNGPETIYALVCDNPYQRERFMHLPAAIREPALPTMLLMQLTNWTLNAEAFTQLQETCAAENTAPEDWRLCLALLAIFKGDLATARTSLSLCQSGYRERAYRALILLLEGETDAALLHYREALRLWHACQHTTGRRKPFFPGVIGFFYILGLFQRNQPGDMEEARKLLETIPDSHAFAMSYQLLKLVPALENNNADALLQLQSHLSAISRHNQTDPWYHWFGLWLLHQYQSSNSITECLAQAAAYQQQAQQHGYTWLAAELAALIAHIDPLQSGPKQIAATFEQTTGIKLLMSRNRIEEAWERALNAIQNTLAPKTTLKHDETAEYRLAWLLHRDRTSFLGFSLEAREQKRAASGEWQKGKPLSFKKVAEIAKTVDYFSDQDRRAAAYIAPNRQTGSHELSNRGWLALAGAPNVAWKDSGIAIELIAAEPELRINKKADDSQIKIEFWPLCDIEESIVLAEDGLTRIKIIELKPDHHRLAQIVGKGIVAPESAQQRILASLDAVSSLVTIHSDIGGTGLAAAETVPADTTPHVQLIPEGEGLRTAILIRPFDGKGSYYIPGSGGTNLIAEIGGQRLQTQRDLMLERNLANSIVARCPSLSSLAKPLTPFVWTLESAYNSLEFLLELRAVGDAARIEWPQGEKFKVLGQAGLGQFNLRIKQQRDWFSVSGELKLDDGLVVSMQTLLELTENTQSKFIRLDEGRFLALTEAFKKRLDDLRTYSEKHGKNQRIHALALPVLDEITAEAGLFQSDAAWQAQVQRLHHATQVKPILPPTLQAELRDYQRDGFNWLYRLSAWGVGACLADDMGLGKTLQALAIILSRADEGPTLVIAPTSVCMNWHSEAQRFAPTLTVHLLGDSDRQALIKNLRPMDLLICSYALLQQDAVGKLLAATTWQTIVLDEAQMIKNPATKRSRQAMALQSGFKIITTGTPVENHLGELWNLFRFINPGLLGSLESFNRRFAAPIERNQDREAKQRLKRMIQPFILRRTKAQVLSELPPRTEIELQVELSAQEMAFYEALRRKLLKEIDKNRGSEEDNRFKVLAAITKLRRACCNAQLAAPELTLPSSKLALFGEILSELLDNRHKTLVFSQFVDHLRLIRDYLDENSIGYQYLDGQTPVQERKKRVDAFQAGQGDVFLISLKAGGVGLNLTAADYVIHMDPWWNPAVEDQASDRAHRIGQQRPVTVYRLVTKNTIEQQIVSLHRHKRDLADSVLGGGEISGKISAQELLALMRG